MGDIADQASELTEVLENNAIENSRKAANQPANAITECVECGDEIDPRRKKLVPSTDVCGPCASLREQKKRFLTGHR